VRDRVSPEGRRVNGSPADHGVVQCVAELEELGHRPRCPLHPALGANGVVHAQEPGFEPRLRVAKEEARQPVAGEEQPTGHEQIDPQGIGEGAGRERCEREGQRGGEGNVAPADRLRQRGECQDEPVGRSRECPDGHVVYCAEPAGPGSGIRD